MHTNSVLSHSQHVASGDSKNRREAVYGILKNADGLTDRQVMGALGSVDPNYVRPAITRLVKDGLVQEVTSVPCPVTGRTVRVCKVTATPYFN